MLPVSNQIYQHYTKRIHIILEILTQLKLRPTLRGWTTHALKDVLGSVKTAASQLGTAVWVDLDIFYSYIPMWNACVVQCFETFENLSSPLLERTFALQSMHLKALFNVPAFHQFSQYYQISIFKPWVIHWNQMDIFYIRPYF